ncbi:flagellar basal body rod protein FlgC [Desulfomicrobium escambiense]|uniref:flagellar basal body rod protein FlgC n=1 Tax=Desulfomicrobium escambiense TaxID=29503 RepID=UPI00041C1FB0|nr:flagellar basal body rod protein FlgC [Desulfomicrobium escambiense]
MDFMTSIDIGASALKAERTHLNVISMNLANAKTTRTVGGGPYRRKEAIFKETEVDSPFSKAMNAALDQDVKGVRVESIQNDRRPLKQVYEPGHPDANEEGYVSYPDINVVEEMTNMLQAMRAYEANVSTITTSKNMFTKALEIGR